MSAWVAIFAHGKQMGYPIYERLSRYHRPPSAEAEPGYSVLFLTSSMFRTSDVFLSTSEDYSANH
jgi:hypothetical protein